MATLNTSSEGSAITKAYQSVVDTPLPTDSSASSPTYGQWVVYAVQAPLASAFQNDSGKESILKVFRTGEGELVDLVDEFSEGKIQFAYVKVKDPNTSLPKSVLIAWCGEGVPERTKGYFTSHLAAVAKLLHGYHVQVTARTDSDLSPEGIVRKVADASGSKYSGDSTGSLGSSKPPPPVASKPVFTPSRVGGAAGGGFNPLSVRSARAAPQTTNADDDGWGDDAPPVTRSQIQKVDSAYKPTKVNMAELTSQKPETSRMRDFEPSQVASGNSDVVKGGYQPIGKVDIASIRRQAQEQGTLQDDRPSAVKGSYEPVGKVDIAAIRARAQGPVESASPPPPPVQTSEEDSGEAPRSMADRSAAFSQQERLTSMPKPRVANRFGSGAAFTGTKAPAPETTPAAPSAAPVGIASRTFADEGGKTPAQLWAERKARERGNSGAGDTSVPAMAGAAVGSQTGAGGQWESGYTGKKWGTVQPVGMGRPGAGSLHQQERADDDETNNGEQPASVSEMRNRFAGAAPMGAAADDDFEAPPPTNISSKPIASRGVPMPGLPSRPLAQEPEEEEEEEQPALDTRRMPEPPAQPPRSPTPEEEDDVRPSSPIRIAQPIGRGGEPHEMSPPAEREDPPAMPVRSMAHAAPMEDELDEEPHSARATAEAAAAPTVGHYETQAHHTANDGGKRALVQYDYEKAEENELELKEGEYVVDIDMVDEDWWQGTNPLTGEIGLFPANYVELVEDGPQAEAGHVAHAPVEPEPHHGGKTATAQYDYEAAEENELSFPEGAKITNVEFPDDDWWFGHFNGHEGLFPANYVELDN